VFVSEKCNRSFSDISALNISKSDPFYVGNPTVVSIILLLEFNGNLTIIAILFYLRNPTIVSMFLYFEFEANLTIVAILFSLRNPTIFSTFFTLNLQEIYP